MPEALPRLNASDWIDRLRITLACRDADLLPRVPNAGKLEVINGTDVQIMHNGIAVLKDGYDGNYMTQLMQYMRGVHEPQEEKCFAEVLKHIKSGGKMIELGSYWGFYSLWFWKVVENAECHLIEVDNKLMEVGIRNFELNGAKGIFTNAGIGRPDLTAWHTNLHGNYIRTLPSGQIFFDRPWPTPGLHRNVPLINISQYMTDNLIERLDILHADIQGQEQCMLDQIKDMPRPIPIDYLFISTHYGDDFHKSCLEKVIDVGYAIIAEHNVSDSFSGDGLIVARRTDIDGPTHIDISRRSETIY